MLILNFISMTWLLFSHRIRIFVRPRQFLLSLSLYVIFFIILQNGRMKKKADGGEFRQKSIFGRGISLLNREKLANSEKKTADFIRIFFPVRLSNRLLDRKSICNTNYLISFFSSSLFLSLLQPPYARSTKRRVVSTQSTNAICRMAGEHDVINNSQRKWYLFATITCRWEGPSANTHRNTRSDL